MPRTSKDSRAPQRRQRSSHQPSLPGYIGGLRRSRGFRWHSYLSLWCRLPRNPNSIAILQCADPPKTCNASMWLTDLGPPPTKALCWISAFETPPSAVPKLTPILSWGLSAEYSRPLSSRASLAEATANWAYLSNRFNRCGEKYSSGFQSSTSAELVDLNTDGSNPETGPIPDLRSLMAAQNFFLPTPIDVIGPTPVMTTCLIVR